MVNDMKRFHTVKQTRKQAEQSILMNMRKILTDLDTHKNNRESICKEKAETADNTDEKIDREHVMSVVSRFTALKRAIKF